MKPRNRISHSYTRWPSDPEQRLELADVDIDFCAAMAQIVGMDSELDRIGARAMDVIEQAKQELT